VIDYRRLDVYWDARKLAKDLYQATRQLPPYLRWRLGGQLDDAVDSIGSNLAEGSGRKNVSHGNTELIRYCHMAYGSACETEHRIDSLHDRDLIETQAYEDFAARIDAIKGKLWSLIRAWKRADRGRQ
jgi:four helix bundle protein